MLIGDAIDVFRKGKTVANPVLWKNVGATASLLAGLITSALAVAAAFGYRLDVDSDLVEALASGVAAALFLLSGGLHITTSDKVGLPPKPESGDGPGETGPVFNYDDMANRG